MKYTDEQLEKIRKECEESLKHVKGLVSVCIGLKEKGDDVIFEKCFRIYLKKKKRLKDIPKNQIIPIEFKGVRTDVIEMIVEELQIDTSKYRPLMGGIQISNNKSTGDGTLACLATDQLEGTVVMLSNHHVLFGDNAQVGDKVGQPYHSACGPCCICNEVANLVRSVHDGPKGVDCAIARLTRGTSYTNEINGLNVNGMNTIYGVGNPGGSPNVFKVGRTTGRTEGIIVAAAAQSDVRQKDGTIITFQNQIHIRHISGTNTPFTAGGDSGSAIINDQNQIVGLHMSGPDSAPFRSSANNIQNVINELKIDINFTGTADSIPIIHSIPIPKNEASNEDILLDLEKQITDIPFGKEISDIIYTHKTEVMNLINTSREVKVAWNRYQGPAFIAHFMKSGAKKDHQIPKEINGISIQNLLVKMTVALEENGSKELVADINKYGLDIMTCMNKCQSIREITEFIKRKDKIFEPQY